MNGGTLQILHLEDDTYDAELAREMLRTGGIPCRVHRVDTEIDFVAALRESDYDLIMADNAMPTFDGLSALALAREVAPETPFIFLSGSLGEEVAIESLKSGATDYVLKQRLARLVPVVQRAFREARERQQRRDAQAALQRSEERFRALIEQSADGIAMIDPDGMLLYASPSVRGILGMEPEEMVGRSVQEFIHPAQADANRALIAGALEHPAIPVHGRVRYRHRDGGWRWIEAAFTNLISQPGVEAIVINFRDITARQRAEENLRARLDELEAVARISSALRIAESRTEMPAIIMNEIAAMLRAEGVAFIFREPERGGLVVEAATPGFELEGEHPLGPRSAVIHEVLDTGEAYYRGAVGEAAVPRPTTGKLVTSVACVPLRRADMVIGVLWLARSGSIDEHDINVLTAISDIATNALHRTTLHERTLLQLQRLAALRDIDRAITTNSDLSETLDFLLERVKVQLDVDAAVILQLDPEARRLTYLAGTGFRGSQIRETSQLLGEGHAGQAARERRLVVVSDLAWARPTFLRRSMVEEEGFVNYYAVPLVTKTQVRGVLEVYNRSPFKPSSEWLDFLQTLANQAAIALDNAELYAGLQQSNLELREAYDTTIEGWSRALDLRDRETEGHTQRVAELTVALARRQGFSEDEITHIRRGALLHDIGKMGVPDQILHKPGALSDAEWDVMRMHPTFAYELLSPIAYLHPALDIPYCHHEKWNGSGYPRGLRGEDIPAAARLFAVVDVWDALRSDRPYRGAWPAEKALAQILSDSGTHFDPQAVKLFLEVMQDRAD